LIPRRLVIKEVRKAVNRIALVVGKKNKNLTKPRSRIPASRREAIKAWYGRESLRRREIQSQGVWSASNPFIPSKEGGVRADVAMIRLTPWHRQLNQIAVTRVCEGKCGRSHHQSPLAVLISGKRGPSKKKDAQKIPAIRGVVLMGIQKREKGLGKGLHSGKV